MKIYKRKMYVFYFMSFFVIVEIKKEKNIDENCVNFPDGPQTEQNLSSVKIFGKIF